MHRGTVCLFSVDTLNVDYKFLSVYLNDLSHGLSFVMTTDNLRVRKFITMYQAEWFTCYLLMDIKTLLTTPLTLVIWTHDPEVGHACVCWLAANCVKTMWLAEQGLHSDNGYLRKELMGQRNRPRLSDKDFNDTMIKSLPRFIYRCNPIPSSYCSEHKDMIQHSPSYPLPFSSALDKQWAIFSACFHPLLHWHIE